MTLIRPCALWAGVSAAWWAEEDDGGISRRVPSRRLPWVTDCDGSRSWTRHGASLPAFQPPATIRKACTHTMAMNSFFKQQQSKAAQKKEQEDTQHQPWVEK